MKSYKVFLALAFIVLPCILGDACTNYQYDLSSFRLDDTDWVAHPIIYGGMEWDLVFNFCRNTVHTCMWVHLAAFLCSPGFGIRCTPTLTSGDWYEANYGVSTYNGGKEISLFHIDQYIYLMWPSKILGYFEMCLKCDPTCPDGYICGGKFVQGSEFWKLYFSSKKCTFCLL